MIFQIFLNDPFAGFVILGAIIVAIAVHEAAHAYAANWFGDDTPKLQGRLSLNPLDHLDPWGTLLIIFAGIGWGKPVQFNPFNLKNPRRDTALVALAGPMSNILMALVAVIIMQITNVGSEFEFIFNQFINLNLFLALFNLIPIEPLDGFKVVAGILPPGLVYQWEETKRYGLIILLFLIFTGVAINIVVPAAMTIKSLMLVLTSF